MEHRACNLCSYWLPLDHNRSSASPASTVLGECRRQAPAVKLAEKGNWPGHANHAIWTLTQLDDWCGDFQLDTAKSQALEAYQRSKASLDTDS